MPKAPAPESITVEYRLEDLPTAQHKAGLAGLLLAIEDLQERRDRGVSGSAPPRVVEEGATSATFEFNRESLKALLNDLYDAETVERQVKAKWQGKKPKRVDEVPATPPATGQEKRFVYDVVRPTGHFLRRYTGDEDPGGWLKLWREMLWAVPRSRPTTRLPYNRRAEGQDSREGVTAWEALVADARGRRGAGKRIEVSSSLLLGAQAKTAEAIRFDGDAKQVLLLHFWQLSCRIFVPRVIDEKGKEAFTGFTLAIPEVRDLRSFKRRHRAALQKLDTAKLGYRPASSVISLPAQGGLEFLRHLQEVGEAEATESLPTRYLDAVEYHHLVKSGNNVKTLQSGRIVPQPLTLRRYKTLRERLKNPLLLSCRLQALLAGEPWFRPLAEPLRLLPSHWFVHATQPHRTPHAMLSFAREVEHAFRETEIIMNDPVQEPGAASAAAPEHVDRTVYRLVQRYVRTRALGKTQQPEDQPVVWSDPGVQRELERAAHGLFLELRSRRDTDFVQHFTATLGSVSQYLPIEDYAAVTGALLRRHATTDGQRTREDVKTLTLLALSAAGRHSPSPSSPAAAETTSPS